MSGKLLSGQRVRALCPTLLWLLLLAAAWPAHADFAGAADRIRDSVVTVMVDKSMGTGFIVSPDGDVLTNKHVIGQATAAQVKLSNGDEVPATVAKVSAQQDLAVLKIDRQHLPAVVFASSAKLKQGSEVAALGVPFGLSDTLTKGIVSSPSRDIEGRKYIQIDAALNQGNSGGPVINDQGQVVGVATKAALKAENMGFAIPSDDVVAFLTEAKVTFSMLDATPGSPAPASSPAGAAPATPAVPAAPPPTPPAPAGIMQPWMWLVAAALVAFLVSLVTSLLVAKSASRGAAPVPAMPYAPPTAGWGQAPPAQPGLPLPPQPAAPPPRDDLSDIDIELR